MHLMAAGMFVVLLLPASPQHPNRQVLCRVELEKGTLPAGVEQTAIVKVLLDAQAAPGSGDRPPVNLAVVLDKSGSMRGAKIEKAKEAAIAALRRLNDGDLFSLVTYDRVVQTVVPAQSARNTKWIEERIRGIGANGSTALFGGVSQGASEVRRNSHNREYVHRIILLSDGQANVGPSSPQELARLGAALIKEDISVTTVGVGTDYNEDLMTQLAQKSDGNTYFVESGEDLPRIFAAELGDVLSVVARKVTLEIECPDGTRPVRIIGREGRISGAKVEVYLNQLYGGQEKYALVEVAVPATAANSSREIAVAKCTYENAVTRRRETSTARAAARFSKREEDVVRSVNVKVQADYNDNDVAIIKDQVVELTDQGKKADAVRVMREKSKELQKLSAKFDNAQLQQQSAALAQEADELEEKGMSKARRKWFRAESFQTRNQQKAK